LFLHNDPLTMRGLRRRFERRLALRRLSLVVCVSDYLKTRFMTGLRGTGAAVLHNPLTLSELPPPSPERGRSILFVGRITTDKAPDVFIAACALALAKMPGWSARMIGGDRFGPDSPETPYVARMRDAAAAAAVRFEGPRCHDEVLAAMAGAEIVVVPSRWAEPFGLTALEALASGAALITTGQGGLREVAGDAAVYVPPDDAPALAQALLALSAAPQKLAALRTAGLERAKLFNTPVIAARLEALRAAR
jgi:UDP-glucose:(glucosyl)LPS alpha-1,2-glucosyltransferase